MSFQIPNEVPPEVKKALGPLNATKVVTGPDGKPTVISDDLSIGKFSFDKNYENSKGDLTTVDKNAGAFLDGWASINNPHLSPALRAAGAGVMVTALSGVATTAVVALGGAAATVPIIGAVVLAVIAVAVVVFSIMGAIFKETEFKERTSEQKFNRAVNQIPGDIPFPSGLNHPDEQALKAMELLSRIFLWEQRGEPQNAIDLRLQMSLALGGQSGLAKDIYQIVADVVFDNRWQAGKIFPFVFASITYPEWLKTMKEWHSCKTGTPHACPTTYGADPFVNADDDWVIPRNVMSEYWAPGNPQVEPGPGGINPANAWQVREAEGEFVTWYQPDQNFSISPAPDAFPYGVGRYLIIFAVLYSLTDPKQARAATYAAVYLILIQKAWAYKTVGKEIPEGLYNSMGFLLDLIANSPVATAVTFRNPVSHVSQTSQPVFHDVDWFVKGYLKNALKYAPAKSFETTKSQFESGPSIKAADTSTKTAPVPPKTSVVTKLPGTAPGMRARISGYTDELLLLRPGGYMVEFESQSPDGAGVPELLRYNGVQATGMRQILPPSAGQAGRYRIFIRTPRAFQLRNLPGLRWVISRKLSL